MKFVALLLVLTVVLWRIRVARCVAAKKLTELFNKAQSRYPQDEGWSLHSMKHKGQWVVICVQRDEPGFTLVTDKQAVPRALPGGLMLGALAGIRWFLGRRSRRFIDLSRADILRDCKCMLRADYSPGFIRLCVFISIVRTLGAIGWDFIKHLLKVAFIAEFFHKIISRL